MSNNEIILKNLAEKVLAQVPMQNKDKYGSVIVILMIISIILTAIRTIQECNKSKLDTLKFKEKCDTYGAQIKQLSIKRGWFTKMRLKKIIRRELDKEDYRDYGASLVDAILNTGENLTEDELTALMETSNG